MSTNPRPWYATNARQLLETRQRGMVPAGAVVVNMRPGGDNVAPATLHLRDDMPLDRMDWRMLVNLDVWVWADGAVPLDRVLAALDGIARARPKRLCLRFDHPLDYTGLTGEQVHVDSHDLQLGFGLHWPGLPPEYPATHEFHWHPMPMQGTPVEHRLRAAARSTHLQGTIL